MKLPLSSLSIRAKLLAIMMLTSLVALVLTCIGLIGYSYVTAGRDLGREMTGIADVVAANGLAALQFGDRPAAERTLGALGADHRIKAATMYAQTSDPFAVYLRTPTTPLLPGREGDPYVRAGYVVVARPMILDSERIGLIVLQADLGDAYALWKQYALLVAGVLAISSSVAFALAFLLRRVIAQPILRLAALSARVPSERDYTIRVERETDDEIGLLFDQFNEMLRQIHMRDTALLRARDDLEQRVQERTRELSDEIAERRRTEEQLLIAKEAAEAASRAKSAFLANMSHELSTPLSAIIGYSELLAVDHNSGPNQKLSDVQKIRTAGRHLRALINNVLDFSRIEAGRMALQIERFEVAPFLDEIVATARPLSRRTTTACTSVASRG